MTGISLFCKVRLTAALLSNDVAAVWEQLYMLPVLQALGTPVVLVTISGCISATIAIGALPLCGWLTDGGSNPRKRKKPAVLLATLLMMMGLGLILTGNAVHLWGKASPNQLSEIEAIHFISASNITNTYSTGISDENTSNVSVGNIVDVKKTGLNATGVWSLETTTDYDRHEQNQNGFTESPHYSGFTSETGSSTGLTENADKSPEVDMAFTNPLGIGVPLVALIAMAGFILLDVGYDLTNAHVKTYVLSVTAPVDHVSLLVTGVLMSALGGCVAAVTGIWDLSSILGLSSYSDAVSSTAVVQLVFIIGLTILCTLCSLVSAPSDPTPVNMAATTSTSLLPHAPAGAKDVGGGELGPGVVDLDMSTAALQTDVQESIILATASPIDVLGLSTSTQVDRNYDYHSISLRLGRPHFSTADKHEDKVKLLNKKASRYKTLHTLELESLKKQQDRKKKWNLVVICVATFFIGGSLFLFIFSVTDYVGKVLYGGDPEAEPDSVEHAQYELGLRTGSLGMLIMNVAYVVFSLVHRRVLTFLGNLRYFIKQRVVDDARRRSDDHLLTAGIFNKLVTVSSITL